MIAARSQVIARRFPRGVLLPYGPAATAIIGLHLALNNVLGFHIDELYYIASGRHPAFGYVDFPPIVPLLARFETDLLGATPWKLRFLPALLGGVNVSICGLYARKLGGSLTVQALALLVGITIPLILGTWLFQAVIFDQLAWMVALYIFLSLVLDPKPRTWLLLGLVLGIGLETKFTIIGLIVGIVVAVFLTPLLRAQLRTKYPWLAAGIALVIWLPNLVWQFANGFPSLTYTLNHGKGQVAGGGIRDYLLIFFVILLLLVPLWFAGLISLFRDRKLRPVGIVATVAFLIFLPVGKGYYPGPAIPIVLVQGLMSLSRLDRRRLRRGLEVAIVVACLLNAILLAKLVLPVTPTDQLHATGVDKSNTDTALTVGWPSIARQITAAYHALPASEKGSTVIVTSDYGGEGTLEIYGNPRALPFVVSPHLSDWYWLPAHVDATHALMVGYAPSDIGWMCMSATVVAHLTVPYQVDNLEQGAPITDCQLSAPLPTYWGRLKNFA